MSRTLKDHPLRVKMLDNLRRGEVWHAHNRLGRTVSGRSQYEYTFWKDDAASIRAFQQYLDSEHIEYAVEETDPTPMFDPHSDRTQPIEYTPRQVVFLVTLRYVKREYTAYCTDYAHYDPQRDVDTRDGKVPVCRPMMDGATFRQEYGGSSKEPYPRNASAMTLQTMAKAYNSGSALDDLEAYDTDVLYRHVKFSDS